MANIPERDQQIIQMHASLIVNVVKACQNPSLVKEIEPVLQAADQYGQGKLATAIRIILKGSRDIALSKNLNEDDAVVIEAILRGIQNPATLPEPKVNADPAAAAPGLAGMIYEAGKGNTQTLQIIAGMAEQMSAAGGSMAKLGGVIRRLVNGERDADALSKGMDARAESLLLSILEELGKLELH